MNRKQLALLVVVLIVLGWAGLYIQHNRNNASNTGDEGAGKKLLGNAFPINDVTHIMIKGGTNVLNLVKKDDVWWVRERSDYPASFSQISDLLIKAANLKVVQSEQIGPSQLPRMQLLAPGPGTNTGVLLELMGKDDKALKTVTLGKKHEQKMSPEQAGRFGDEGMADGRYVMVGSDSKNALLISDPLNNVEPKPEIWLNKDFFKVERPKTIAVAYPSAETNSWKITRESESGEWKLADARKDEKLDSGKSSGVTSPFASPTFNDVLPQNAKPEASGLDKPTVVTITTFDDFTYTVRIGKKSGEDYPLKIEVAANLPTERVPAKDEKPEDKEKNEKAWKEKQKQLEDKLKHVQSFEKWTYLVPTWNVDPVLKDRKDLLEEKKEEPKKTAGSTPSVEKKDGAAPLDAVEPAPLDKK